MLQHSAAADPCCRWQRATLEASAAEILNFPLAPGPTLPCTLPYPYSLAPPRIAHTPLASQRAPHTTTTINPPLSTS